MTTMTLTKDRIHSGIWSGKLVVPGGSQARPEVLVTHLDQPVPGVNLTAESGARDLWTLQIPIPTSALSEGVQTVLISDGRSGARLGSFCIVTGAPLEDDIRAEVDLLRAELDMLKRAFRRHCLETMA